MSPAADTLARAQSLARHSAFNLKNPNRVRALVGTFAQNQLHFHHKTGEGYRLVSDIVLEIQKDNPQAAARLVNAFNQWKRFDAKRQTLLRAELTRIVETPDLAKDVYETVNRALNA